MTADVVKSYELDYPRGDTPGPRPSPTGRAELAELRMRERCNAGKLASMVAPGGGRGDPRGVGAEPLQRGLLRTGGYEILIIGGHDHEIPEFLEFLPLDMRDGVAGTFSVDPATAPLAGIRGSVGSILLGYQHEQEQRLVAGALEKAAKGGPAALGPESCLWAGSVAAIKALLVQDGATMPGVLCDQSGWLALSGEVCPLCGRPTRRTPDVIDELVASVLDEGGSASHIEADTTLNEYTAAADLRFPLPPVPAVIP